MISIDYFMSHGSPWTFLGHCRLGELIKKFNVNLTRLARGIPGGLSFDYLDEITLTHSIEDRVKIK